MVDVGKQNELHILSVCFYPKLSSMKSACTMLYLHLWLLRLHHVFPYYLIKATTLRKKTLLNIKYILFSSKFFFLKHFSL